MFNQKIYKKFLPLIGSLTFLAGLILFAYLGTFNRYFADDWCYNDDFKTLGLFGTLAGYVFRIKYASNRFSLTLFSGLMYPFGIAGVRIMTGLTISVWLAGIYRILSNLRKQFNLLKSSALTFLISVIYLYYVLYLAPHPYQNLHWRAGFMPYTAPLIFGTLLLGLYTHQMKTGNARRWQVVAIVLLAFFGGGFSEAANTYLVTATFLMMASAYAGKKKNLAWAKTIFPGTVAGFTAALVALIVLVSSPAIPMRMGSYSNPSTLTALPGLTLKLGLDFIEYFVNDLPIPTIMILITAASLGYIFTTSENTLAFKQLLKWSAIILGVSYLLIAASQAPSAYVEQGPPEARGLLPARFTFIAALMMLGWSIGNFTKSKIQHRAATLAAVLIFGLTLVYAGRSILIVNERTPIYTERAVIWDERDAMILTAHEQGIKEVDVRGIDSRPVGGMKDLQPRAKDWINVCAASFYEVDVIKTVPQE